MAGVMHRRRRVIATAHERKLVRQLGVQREDSEMDVGLLVRIGLKGPRISAGASGFMSNVSSWLGCARLKS